LRKFDRDTIAPQQNAMPDEKNERRNSFNPRSPLPMRHTVYLQYVYAHDTLLSIKEGSMPNMTLSIPVELKQKMDRFKEINWSEVARQAILEKTLLMGRMNQLMTSSRISEPEALYEGRKISRKVSKKHK